MRGSAPTLAVLVRSLDYRDADRIVTLLTEEHGKVDALARGARKSKRRFAGALQAFAVLRVAVRSGRGTLDTLTEAQTVEVFPNLLRSYRTAQIAGAGTEWLRELTPMREPDPRPFQSAVRWLRALADTDRELELFLSYCIRVLAISGFAPQVDQCAPCGRVPAADQAALFAPRLGAVVCRACGGGPLKLSGQARAAVRVARTDRWEEAADMLDSASVSTLRTLCREVARNQAGKDLPVDALFA
ncbi:MAG: DNA repair protein RecO [Myxococcota bacterium]